MLTSVGLRPPSVSKTVLLYFELFPFLQSHIIDKRTKLPLKPRIKSKVVLVHRVVSYHLVKDTLVNHSNTFINILSYFASPESNNGPSQR